VTPASGFKLGDGLGLEVPTAIATHDHQLTVDGLDDIGGRQRATNAGGVVEEGQAVIPFLADLGDEGGRARFKTLTKVLEPRGGDFRIPSRLHPTARRWLFPDRTFKLLALTAARRQAVGEIRPAHPDPSERRVCGLAGLGRSSHRYQRQRSKDSGLRERLKKLAGDGRRYGYRRLTILLNGRGRLLITSAATGCTGKRCWA
jgi:hypothetical protein